jgi:putative transposase
MLLTYQYKLKPAKEQKAVMLQWLELLRRHYNYALAQRLDWLKRTRCSIDRCSLISEPIGEIPEKFPNYNVQAGELKLSKELFPAYKDIYHDVQQQNLKRLDKAWERWIKPDSSGKRGGRPRFKSSGELRSFTSPRVNCPKAGANLNNGILKLSKIGEIPVIVHRPIPDSASGSDVGASGFTLKTCSIIYKADGWYCSISMENGTVPESLPLDTVKTAAGVDVGLKEFLTTSAGKTVPIQQIYGKALLSLGRQQRFLKRKEKGSKRHQKQQNFIARIHQRIGRQRKDFHYNVAHGLVKTYDLIAVEDLNIRGLARTKLAKSILDAAWGQFITILETVAVKCGVRVVKVKPHGTSQDCSSCGTKVPKTLSIRTHSCPKCGCCLDRDENAAINILNRALTEVGLILASQCRLGETPSGASGAARGGFEDTQPVKRELLGMKGTQLSLF